MDHAANCKDLVIVAGHAPFKRTTRAVPSDLEHDRWWCLQSFQEGEPPFFVEHIRHGVVHVANNTDALLLLSGTVSREERGWSEARTYYAIAEAREWWVPPDRDDLKLSIANRTDVELFARDSLENLLFSILRFHELTGKHPRNITVVSWAFKMARFHLHRAAISWPADRFRYDGVNSPFDLAAAERNEASALRDFVETPLGTVGPLAAKREKRSKGGQPSYEPLANIYTAAGPRFPWHQPRNQS